MVMPADGPTPTPDPRCPRPAGSGEFAATLNKIFGSEATPVGEAPAAPKARPAPKDSPEFIRRYADAAVASASEAVRRAACGCAQCALGVLESQIIAYVCTETVSAAFTGDTGKLRAIVELIEQQRRGA